MKSILHLFFLVTITISCRNTTTNGQVLQGRITPAAERSHLYLPLLQGKKVAVIVNQTSMVGKVHLIDHLLRNGIDVSLIFSPEHGFKGDADAGEKIEDGDTDSYKGIPVRSLYGENKTPKIKDLRGIDIMVFDIQDVGVRFYTYISTLHHVMESSVETTTPLIILDRPNPLAGYVDGPILEDEFKSFVGMHPVPVVYGLTIGEYAQMINGEGWLIYNSKADIKVIPIGNYSHDATYILPIKPSPNLPNNIAIGHYPSLCFFEGTTVSVGRGTEAPFQQIGHPAYKGEHSFTPRSGPGSKYPKHENKLCGGVDLKKTLPSNDGLDLSYLIAFHAALKEAKEPFFNENNFFELLAGTAQLRKMINEGIHEDEIKAHWEPGLLEYKMMRKKYLMYE